MTNSIQLPSRFSFHSAIAILLTITLTLNGKAQNTDTKAQTVTLKRGQVLELSLLTPLDSRQAEVGDQILFGLTHPLIADGVAVLPAAWIIRSPVSYVVRPRKNCGGGVYFWKLQSVELPDGTKVKLQPISRDLANAHGNLVEQVVLDSNEKKRPQKPKRKNNKWAMAPLQIVAIPLWIVIAIGMQIDENGGGCTNGIIPVGFHFYRAVSEDVRALNP